LNSFRTCPLRPDGYQPKEGLPAEGGATGDQGIEG
jgi:hypothetical protein